MNNRRSLAIKEDSEKTQPRRSLRIAHQATPNYIEYAPLKSVKRNKIKSNQLYGYNQDDDDDDDDDDDENNENDNLNEIYKKDSKRYPLTDNNDIAGSQLFGFQTPKKPKAMLEKAKNTPTIPTSLLKKMHLNSPLSESPTRKMHKLRLESTPQTPKTPASSKFIAIPKTAPKIRERNFKIFAYADMQAQIDNEDDNSDFEISSSESSSDSEHSDESTSSESHNEHKNKIESPRKKFIERDFIPDSDHYFMSASNKNIKTSNNTLNNLKSTRLQHENLLKLLNRIDSSDEHNAKMNKLMDNHKKYFNKWMLELSKGFNILTYGFGSKQRLLYDFCEEYLQDQPLIIVNGFFPSISVKDILLNIKTELLEMKSTARNEHDLVDSISLALKQLPNLHIFLIINNIDGTMLRKTKDQHILSRLAKLKNVHLVASIDHINAPMIWDQTCAYNFNFVWYNCTTMLSYKHETAFENSVFLQNSGELNLAAMSNVFESVNNKARGSYLILVKHHLDNKIDANYQGMPFKDFYHNCREHFYASSDSALRTQLVEFTDHHMAKIKRSNDGIEFVSIPINSNLLNIFYEKYNQ